MGAAQGVEEIIVADPAERLVRCFLRDGERFAAAPTSALLGVGADDLTGAIDWPPMLGVVSDPGSALTGHGRAPPADTESDGQMQCVKGAQDGGYELGRHVVGSPTDGEQRDGVEVGPGGGQR